jgi:uncharacterized protein
MLKCFSDYMAVKGSNEGVLSALASTATQDRDGEVILPTAFMLDAYRRNPVILANHTHRTHDGSPSIIGSAHRIEVKDGALEFDMKFASTPLGQQWKTLFDEGHARAFSVGFIPKKGDWQERGGKAVYVHTEVDLLEISAVGVPSNPDALRRTPGELTVQEFITLKEAISNVGKK